MQTSSKARLVALTLGLLVSLPLQGTAGSAAPAAHAAPELAQTTPAITPSTLKDTVDHAMRGLRSLQDPATGAYGNNVRVTQDALNAFALCHRAYRNGDGPFIDRAIDWLVAQQAANGSWVDADRVGVGERLVKLRTLGVLGALESLGGNASREARVRARTFLGLAPDAPAASDATAALADVPTDVLLAQAAELLQTMRPDGTFGEGDARVETSAAEALRLVGLHRELARREKKDADGSPLVPLPGFGPGDRASAAKALARGASFLLGARRADGLWGFGEDRSDPELTAMAVLGLVAVPAPRDAEVQGAIDRALDYLRGLQKENGSIHDGQLANYVTSASVIAMAAAGREADKDALARARAYLHELQADEGEGYAPTNRYYGGVGYGDDERPDLSNLNLALEALASGPSGTDDEAFKKALIFLQRCQNFSEANDLVIEADGGRIEAGTDGGASYAPGESKAGFIELEGGVRVPRSYGSMSYALLRGYLFAGLQKDDPRVAALWKWIQSHYTLDVNPGFEASSDPRASYQGLFYYFFTMSGALDLYGADTLVDASGAQHAWRAELVGRLAAMQRQDGSWRNDNSARWFEGNPVLATAYALSCLSRAMPR